MSDEWIELGDAAAFVEGAPVCERVGDTPVVVVRVGGALHCLRNECPHAGLPLGDGDVRGATITCPYHGYTYRLKDGVDIDDPKFGTPATVYEAEERGGKVLVRLSIDDTGA